MSDDPSGVAQVARSMSGYSYGSVLAPWWALGAGVDALVQLAAEDGPLSEPARIGLQIIAIVYNQKVGGKK